MQARYVPVMTGIVIKYKAIAEDAAYYINRGNVLGNANRCNEAINDFNKDYPNDIDLIGLFTVPEDQGKIFNAHNHLTPENPNGHNLSTIITPNGNMKVLEGFLKAEFAFTKLKLYTYNLLVKDLHDFERLELEL